MQINKSDRNDAIGIARIMQTGWFKEVHVQGYREPLGQGRCWPSRRCWSRSSVMIENMFAPSAPGLVIGRAKFNVFAVRAEELIEGRPGVGGWPSDRCSKRAMPSSSRLVSLTARLWNWLAMIRQVCRFMTAPGVSPITALCFKATIDDPTRVCAIEKRRCLRWAKPVDAASGEVDWTGRISNSAATRCYEVICLKQPGFLLTRVPKWSAVARG